MVNYRRNRVRGGSYFFTVTLFDRSATLLTAHIETLRRAFRHTMQAHPFRIDAIVVLPDHLHAVWTLPPGDADYPIRWRAIKSRFSRALAQKEPAIPKNRKGEYRLWQRRYWEHAIRDEPDFQTHVDYIHYNPVKHGLVRHPVDWHYSSFHRYVRLGLLEADWAEGPITSESDNFGE